MVIYLGHTICSFKKVYFRVQDLIGFCLEYHYGNLNCT